MELRSESRLERLLHHGVFCVTAEVVPPRSANPASVTDQARSVVGYADAVNITDNPTASAHMSAVAGSGLAAAAGVEPILQMTCRDRNRIGITSDLLGAWALGARSVLCLGGDPPSVGDHPDAKAVFDLTTIDLVRLVARLRDEGRTMSGAQIESPPRYFIGVADAPLMNGYDLDRLEEKIGAGADFVQTQIVFDVDAFAAWADLARERGILQRAFVLAGVMVVRSAASARYMSEHVPGVVVPESLAARLEEAGPEAESEGVRLTVELVARLKGVAGIHGVHVIGLGNMGPVRSVVEGAGLFPRPGAA